MRRFRGRFRCQECDDPLPLGAAGRMCSFRLMADTLGVSVRELASHLDKPQGTVATYLTGRFKIPKEVMRQIQDFVLEVEFGAREKNPSGRFSRGIQRRMIEIELYKNREKLGYKDD